MDYGNTRGRDQKHAKGSDSVRERRINSANENRSIAIIIIIIIIMYVNCAIYVAYRCVFFWLHAVVVVKTVLAGTCVN